MNPVQLNPPPQRTLFDTYAPVQRYFQSLESGSGHPPMPPIKLQAQDAYLMHLIASMQKRFRTIVDLAGPATWGATTVLWSAQDRRGRVFVSKPTGEGSEKQEWPSALEQFLEETDPPQELEFYQPGAESNSTSLLPDCLLDDRRPVLVTLVLNPRDLQGMVEQIRSIYEANSKAVVLLLPLGLIGEDPAVETLLAWTRSAGLRLASLRELSPFLASSRMALIYPADDVDIPEVLKRIRRLFTGNYDFLALAQQTFSLNQANALLDAKIKTCQARCGQLEQAVHEWERRYEQAVFEWEKRYEDVAGREREVSEFARTLERRLITLTNGTGWALLQKMMWLRLKLLPRDSVRERAGRFVMRQQRRLRQGIHRLWPSGPVHQASGVR